MKDSIIFLDAILILSIVVPYYLFIRAGRNAEKDRLKKFGAIAAENSLMPDMQEHWNATYIGIDTRLQKLIFIRLDGEQATVESVNLKKVTDSNLVRHTVHKRVGKSKQEVLTYLGLRISLSVPKGGILELPFYKHEEQWAEDYEVARAEKWLGIIRRHQPKKPSSIAA